MIDSGAVIIGTLPITLVFALLGGLMIFIGTYAHFPKMEERKRMVLSLKNAAYITITLIVLVYLFLILLFEGGVYK